MLSPLGSILWSVPYIALPFVKKSSRPEGELIEAEPLLITTVQESTEELKLHFQKKFCCMYHSR